jgi:transposase
MNVRYRVTLTDDERGELKELIAKGKRAARKLKRAQILLAADGGQSDEAIAANVSVGTSTVYRTKRRFVEGNLESALSDAARPGAKRKLSGKEEALLVATVCSAPPEGRARWTLDLLAGRLVTLTDHEAVSRETVRRRLSENELKPWREEMWCIPELNGEYVARMEHVLDLYAEEPDPQRPVVCFDESPTQLIGEVRAPIPAKPGQLQRYDSEYKRNGTVNLFIFVDVHRRWRHVKVTDRRTAVDFATCMKELVDVHYPGVEKVRVVMDNLSTHTIGALYEAFEPDEARRILRKLEFHFVPKHASWLNMAEIEIGVLRAQCIGRRIDSVDELRSEIAAWEKERNAAKATIEWSFTTEKARTKMGHAYPKPSTTAADDQTGIMNPPSPRPTSPTKAVEACSTEAVAASSTAAVEASSTAAVEASSTETIEASSTETIEASSTEAVEASSTEAIEASSTEAIEARPVAPPATGDRRAKSIKTNAEGESAANKPPKLTSRRPRSRFMAPPTIPKQRPKKKKQTSRTTAARTG